MTGALAAILVAATLTQTPADSYAWPLDLPRQLTSSFAEYRPGRYHMGIDLRTGPIGKNVYAAADGYVSRLRCSPYGYGKAVYLQLDDGNSAVYAHLDDFAPALRDYVRAAQHAREEYTVDLTPKPNEFRVKRGDLIAKSGQTGIGVPHLHYELRDRSGVPINPRTLGVTWPDKTPPELMAINLVPLTPRSHVNGHFSRWPVTLYNPQDQGLFLPEEPAQVAGRFGVSITAYDPAEGNTRLGLYRATVSLDDVEMFTVLNERVSYDHSENGAIAFFMWREGPIPDLRLWRAPGNDAEPYLRSPSADGTMELNNAEARLTVSIEDFSGNTKSFTVPLHRDSDELPVPEDRQERGDGTATFEYTGQLLVVTADFPGDEIEKPVLVVAGDRLQEIPFRRVAPRQYQVAYLPDTPVDDLVFHVEHPLLKEREHRFVFVRRGQPEQRFTFGDLEVVTAPESPYGTLAFEARASAAASAPELRPVSQAYDVQPNDLAVDAPITLSLPIATAHPERVLFYRRNVAKKEWVRQDTKRDGDRVTMTTRQLGMYALLEDTTAPQIKAMLPEKTDPAARRRELAYMAVDKGSGVESWKLTYNGKWLLTEYDPERDMLEWEQDEDLPTGPGTLVVEVRDHAGNVARTERELTITAP